MDPISMLDPEVRQRIAAFCRQVLATLEGTEPGAGALPLPHNDNGTALSAPDPLTAMFGAIVDKYGPLAPGLTPPALRIPFVEIPALPLEER